MTNPSLLKAFEEWAKNFKPEEIFAFLRNTNLETLKAAWNYKEENVAKISFKELIAWVQDNIKQDKHGGVVILKEKGKQRALSLKVMLLDKAEKPLSNLGDPYLVVETDAMDEDLINNFGDKDMVILK